MYFEMINELAKRIYENSLKKYNDTGILFVSSAFEPLAINKIETKNFNMCLQEAAKEVERLFKLSRNIN